MKKGDIIKLKYPDKMTGGKWHYIFRNAKIAGEWENYYVVRAMKGAIPTLYSKKQIEKMIREFEEQSK